MRIECNSFDSLNQISQALRDNNIDHMTGLGSKVIQINDNTTVYELERSAEGFEIEQVRFEREIVIIIE